MQTPLDKFTDKDYDKKYKKWLGTRPNCFKCGKPILDIVEMNELVNGEWQPLCLDCSINWGKDFKKVGDKNI